jgi:ABC-type tungstate transport system permease subunit
VDIAAERIYVSGGSMATVLRQGDEQLAYTLSDAATWWQLAPSLSLKELLAGNTALINTYAVIYDPAANELDAKRHYKFEDRHDKHTSSPCPARLPPPTYLNRSCMRATISE